jgi:hypothetical protein
MSSGSYDVSKNAEGVTATVKEPSAEFMAKLEKEGMEKLAAVQKATNSIIPPEKSLVGIMQAGFDQFKKETGRPMTYGEMRDLYG